MTAMGTGAMLRLKSTSARKSMGASVAPSVTQPAAPPTSARFMLVARSLMAATRRDHCCFDTAATASADSSSGASGVQRLDGQVRHPEARLPYGPVGHL